MSDNKRIAKNTIFLYFRSFLIMAVGLYSSRVILQVLGVEDYGLYSAVGSIVVMFSFINGTLSAGTSRFLTFELGKNDEENLKKTFSAAFAMHLILAGLLCVLMETVGLWFLNNKIEIPEGRTFAANVVYQLSILTCMFSLTQVPYSACIIAHEKMSIYAYVGIAEVVFKLALVFVLLYVPFSDNLIAYAIILAVWSIGLQIFYRNYCYRRFFESHLTLVKDKKIYKNMLSYSLWDFVGSFCAHGNSQGLNILINMFFGVAVNAARAVAYQVESAITQLTNNFMTAVQPQIVKSYAQKNTDRFFELIFEAGKYSYYLLFLVSLPVFLEAEYILSLWLVEVPEYTVMFLKFAVAYQLFRIPMRSVVQGVHATGNIKYLNLTSGCYSAGTFLLAIYIAFKLGAPVWSCFIVQGFNGIILTHFELNSLYRNIKFNRLKYYTEVFLRSWCVTALASIPAIISVLYMEQSFLRLIITTGCAITFSLIGIYYLGITKEMRIKITNAIKAKIGR